MTKLLGSYQIPTLESRFRPAPTTLQAHLDRAASSKKPDPTADGKFRPAEPTNLHEARLDAKVETTYAAKKNAVESILELAKRPDVSIEHLADHKSIMIKAANGEVLAKIIQEKGFTSLHGTNNKPLANLKDSRANERELLSELTKGLNKIEVSKLVHAGKRMSFVALTKLAAGLEAEQPKAVNLQRVKMLIRGHEEHR